MTRSAEARTALLPLLIALASAPVGAQSVTPVGTELQANTYTTSYQVFSSIATDGTGRFVVVWESDGAPGTDDASDLGVRARRFTGSGSAIGEDFQVNTATDGFQGYPEVGKAPDGRFVVVWQSETSSGPDTLGFSIQAQRFSADGELDGGEIQVNSHSTHNQNHPSVAVEVDGGFLVVWHSGSSAGSDSSSTSIQARRFTSDGAPLGEDLQVNLTTAGAQSYPHVAVGPDGDFVVVWQSDGSAGSDASGTSVQARRFGSSGLTIGGEIQVNSYTTGNQGLPSVTFAGSGVFVVAWQAQDASEGDVSGYSVQARRFGFSDGSPLADEVQVNLGTTLAQWTPGVSATPDGGFLVVWSSAVSSGTDSAGTSVQARRFAVDGTPVGGELQVNAITSGTQREPAASVSGDSFVVTWASESSAGDDGSSYSVQARRFLLDAVFTDGFESGDLSAWDG